MHTYQEKINEDFICKQCGGFVSTWRVVSGVVNRNHCPLCLHSLHVDLYQAGDRLCACKAPMAPIGLTLKASRDKYGGCKNGELMLVHACTGCDTLSINRIAADDDPIRLMQVFQDSLLQAPAFHEKFRQAQITPLGAKDRDLVESRLFGSPGQNTTCVQTQLETMC